MKVSKLRAYFRLFRPQSWIKNILVFAAVLFAGRILDAQSWSHATLVFVAFCGLSSLFYIANDWIDRKKDRRHPEKKQRPIASGDVGVGEAVLLAVFLTLVVVGCVTLLPVQRQMPTALVLGLYAILQAGYNAGLKHVFGIDLLVVASGYVLRAVGGGVGISVPVTDWFMLSILLLCLMLIAGKRRAELSVLGKEQANRHRPILSKYSKSLMGRVITMSGTASLVTYALWAIQENGSRNLFQAGLPYSVVFVVFGIVRYFYLVFEEENGGEPARLFWIDRPLQLTAIAWIVYITTLVSLG